MLSVHVVGNFPDLRLSVRDYQTQGSQPEWDRIADISEVEAASLIKSKIITRMGVDDIEGDGDPSDYLTLIKIMSEPIDYVLLVRLPVNKTRNTEISIAIPLDVDSFMFKNQVFLDEFISSTGVGYEELPFIKESESVG